MQPRKTIISGLTFIALMLCSPASWAQKTKSFIGRLEYSIIPSDTAMQKIIPENKMIVYSNDTIVRIENFTSHLGKQVTIRHMHLNKSYILLSTAFGNYAIQADNSKTDTIPSDPEKKYTLKKKCFKRKLLARKAKRMIASHKAFKEPREFLYYKGYSTEIIDAFDDMPGLPVKYSLVTPDAILDYELTKMSEYTPDRDLFGIPSDYEKISFNDFMDKLIESKSEFSPEGAPAPPKGN